MLQNTKCDKLQNVINYKILENYRLLHINKCYKVLNGNKYLMLQINKC